MKDQLESELAKLRAKHVELIKSFQEQLDSVT